MKTWQYALASWVLLVLGWALLIENQSGFAILCFLGSLVGHLKVLATPRTL